MFAFTLACLFGIGLAVGVNLHVVAEERRMEREAMERAKAEYLKYVKTY